MKCEHGTKVSGSAAYFLIDGGACWFLEVTDIGKDGSSRGVQKSPGLLLTPTSSPSVPQVSLVKLHKSLSVLRASPPP